MEGVAKESFKEKDYAVDGKRLRDKVERAEVRRRIK
jgi:hypothetical protein